MKASKETIIRTVLHVVAIVNIILQMKGKNTLPFTDEEISQLISLIFLICTSVATWWKNNSFTIPAIKADEYMKQEKLKSTKAEEKDYE